ncbi:hypothetical protein BLA29_008870 [Euroglyphus maynei]|uniref:AAR2 C-terminal domain-containing protein n=1 Tax=Euroglyphus maynei TaxID=6958 RepID=A0A1Y3BJL3_EURMA|nr:hypothetical protein BLA29_008870 [Euroglyphus maynei]
MNPECGKIYSASNLVYKTNANDTNVSSNAENNNNNRYCRVDHQGLPDMIISPESAIKFPSAPIPKHFLYPDGSTPTEITQHSIDSTYTVEHLIVDRHENCQFDLLGELQFAFIIFLLGHQFEAFEHWEHLIRILCSCRQALSERPEFFLAFIRVLHFQLKQTDQAIFADIVDNENRVYHWIRTFFMNIRSMNESIRSDLVERADKFRHFLTKTLRWDFGNIDRKQNDDDDDDENMPEDEKPVIVMM